MPRMRSTLILALAVFALPLFGQRVPGKIEIVVDLNAHRAYVPYGTVLPPGMQVRVARAVRRQHAKLFDAEAIESSSLPKITEGKSILRAQAPLVFEYAPESRFEESRKHARGANATTGGGGRLRIVPLSRYCSVTTVSVESDGQYGPEYALFDSTFCFTTGIQPGQSDTQDFTAYTYAQDETWAHVTDDLGNYQCFNAPNGYSVAQCTASHTSVLQTHCVNSVYSEGFARHYEWQDNWIFSPVDFFFSVSYCLYSE